VAHPDQFLEPSITSKSLQQSRCLQIDLVDEVQDLAAFEEALADCFGEIELQLDHTGKAGEQM
jgi:hypothetical protein